MVADNKRQTSAILINLITFHQNTYKLHLDKLLTTIQSYNVKKANLFNTAILNHGIKRKHAFIQDIF